jgi:hypothetical protein
MRKLLAIYSLAICSTNAFSSTISTPFSKGECAVSYETAEKTYSFKITKKQEAEKFSQKLPQGSASIACSEELKTQLKIKAQNCEIFCNSN